MYSDGHIYKDTKFVFLNIPFIKFQSNWFQLLSNILFIY